MTNDELVSAMLRLRKKVKELEYAALYNGDEDKLRGMLLVIASDVNDLVAKYPEAPAHEHLKDAE